MQLSKCLLIFLMIPVLFFSCEEKDEEVSGCTDPFAVNYNPAATVDDGSCSYDTSGFVYDPTPYNITLPPGFPQMDIPANNPMRMKGVALGRMLFYDPILSRDSSQSCATCHSQSFNFTDHGNRFSAGINAHLGDRNSMAIVNLGWHPKFFWDGRANSLESQALAPVTNPMEMDNTWNRAVTKLQAHPDYPRLFGEAFGTSTIDSNMVVKAIAQFERAMISANSKYDDFVWRGGSLTDAETDGLDIFTTERGDCFHCHGGPFFSNGTFHNNGLDSAAAWTDLGLFKVTGNQNDRAKFKAPPLRNIELTAPFMHDGRFNTLEEVVEFYNSGVQLSPTVDAIMTKPGKEFGLQLTEQEKANLVAFLKTLTDMSFINNPEFSNPH